MKRLASHLLVGIVAAAAAFAFAPIMVTASQIQRNQGSMYDLQVIARDSHFDPSLTLGNLLRKREKIKRQYSPDQNLNFQVNVTPPRTCEPMNITFSTQGGTPPYTIFVGFSNWYGYTVQLPASYADADVSTWLYQFNVPVFQPATTTSLTTPDAVVVVSDSTGHLLNSSSMQTVVQSDTSCANISGLLDFTFYNDPTITACQPLKIHWNYAAPLPGWEDPVDIFLLRELAPPIHIPVKNSSAGELDYNVTVTPGSNIMITMTSQGGSGGVSGKNTVGGSEYIGLGCLDNLSSTILPIAVPSPTTVLNNLRMPDYTGLVSSVVTSGGVTKTNTASETVRHGDKLDGSSSTGRTVALATAVGAGAAILAALASWCIWRKRHGRRNVFWDVPRSLTGDLNKEFGDAPIDQRFLQNRSKAMIRTGSATVPILGARATTSPPSESEIDRDSHRRQTNMARSESCYSDPQYEGPSPSASQSSPISHSYGNLLSASSSNDVNSHFVPRPRARRSSGSSSTSNPFTNTHAANQSSRSGFRAPFKDRSGSNVDHEMSSMGNSDTMYRTSSHQTSEPSAASFYDADPQYGSRAPSHPTYVQHSDAGLLLDDSLEDEEHIELPPQYDSVPRRAAAARRARNANNSTTAAASSATANSSADPNNQTADIASSTLAQYTDEDGDDSKFWRSVPT